MTQSSWSSAPGGASYLVRDWPGPGGMSRNRPSSRRVASSWTSSFEKLKAARSASMRRGLDAAVVRQPFYIEWVLASWSHTRRW
jgi:hypothetical protein